MKIRITTLFALLTLFLGTAGAQNIGGGATAGVVLSQIDGDTYGGYNKIGWQVGGFAWYDIDSIWAIEPGILVTNRGSREASAVFRLSLTYIDIPLMVNFRVPVKGYNRFIAQAGPSISYLLDAQAGLGNTKRDNRDNYKLYDLGINAGVIYKITESVSFCGRWSRSLLSIRAGTNQYTGGWTTNRYFTFGLRIQSK